MKKKREKTQINKIRNERRELTKKKKNTQRIERKHYKQVCGNKLGTLTKWIHAGKHTIFQN